MYSVGPLGLDEDIYNARDSCTSYAIENTDYLTPLLSINESILVARTPVSSPLRLLVSSLRRNLRRGLIVTYLEVGRLGVELIFNKNVIKLEDNVEYIKETTNIIAILYIKQGYNYKGNILAYLKMSLN